MRRPLMAAACYFLIFASYRYCAGWVHVDRIGGGKAVLETLFERSLELAFAGVLPLALALVVACLLHYGLLRNGHGCSPCRRRKSSRPRANNARGMTSVPRPRIDDRQDQRPVIAL